jgi:predicted nucleotidyltransferase
MNTEQELSEYLLKKYNPLALILHGSRAIGKAREHSDWDFAIFVEKDIETEREIISGQNIEVKAIKYPTEESIVFDYCSILRKENIKTLFDSKGIVAEIAEKAAHYYLTPLNDSPSEISGHKAWFRSHLDGMIDYQNEQEAFFRKLGELYVRSIQYWFRFIHKTYMPQVYDSLPRIENEDPEYFRLLKVLAGNYSNSEKIDAGEKIYKIIWK